MSSNSSSFNPSRLTIENHDSSCGGSCPVCNRLIRYYNPIIITNCDAPYPSSNGDARAEVLECPFCFSILWYHKNL